MKHSGTELGRAIASDGVSIAYTTSGCGPALVCCHAMGVDQSMWDPHREVFSRSHQFITFDQRGSGLSEHPPFTGELEGFYTPEKFGEDLCAVLDALKVERTSILGFSMGAVAALSFATRWPDRVERLILGSAMASRLPEEIVIRARQVEEVLDASGLEQTYEFYFGGSLFAGLEFGEMLRQAMEKATLHGFKGCFRVTIDRPSLLDQLDTVSAPTLVLVGEQDTHYLPEADIICERLRDGRKIVVPGAGHPITVQQPQRFEREVLSFLAGATT